MPTVNTRNNVLQSLATIEETPNEFDHDEGSTELKLPALQQKTSSSSATSSSSSSSNDGLDQEKILQIQTELRDFQAALHSSPSAFLTEMNSLVRASFPTFYEFIAILQQQPAFDKTGFLQEIAKTKTTLYTPRGVTITDPKQVARYFTVESAGRRKPHELIYQAATSKIFEKTSVIESLTCSNGLVRPGLNAKASMKDCSLEISLKNGKPHFVAECFLNVTIPCSRRVGKSASRWTVVGVIAEVFFCPCDETLLVELLHLSPAKAFSERQMRAVAKECVRRSN
eukprot:CAMPEP_0113613782 /NCGR_PEP_ID=MMETSP0017_2-20120614/6822_1 /TAXON_ID=2856 /ORGANISM="Cylindrotheca closterium" /LENGTH=283 /DNA_ID=CAMNT_0000522917 /DNA_START=129 /DNA_END=980 /DNA_ORIENTATION=- /assembly_acc=CAM_ASM_000147